MVVKPNKKVPTGRKTMTPTATATPAVTTTAPITFDCAVCKKRRNSLRADGTANAIKPPNGNLICLSCVQEKEKEEFASGRITMNLVEEGNIWFARSASGKMSFVLVYPEGTNHVVGPAALIANPAFVDRDKFRWQGRVYKNGTAHFQRSKTRIDQGAAPSARGGRPAKATSGRRGTRQTRAATAQPAAT